MVHSTIADPMGEATMSKVYTDEQKRAMTTYVVTKDFGKKSDVYRIVKLRIGVELDMYHVTIHFRGGKLLDKDVWCDCPGFRRQNFDKVEHKHILLVLDYILDRGSPESATYTIVGTGKNAKIKFLDKETA